MNNEPPSYVKSVFVVMAYIVRLMVKPRVMIAATKTV
jgi:hypothetical protein